MALDEALAATARAGGPPTLRLYGWDVPSVSLGRFQPVEDLELSALKGIPYVRRPTGGRAILHGDELTYSFTAPLGLEGMGGGLLETYGVLSQAFMHAFSSLGIQALGGVRGKHAVGNDNNPLCFSSASFGEISSGGRKIIGSAQRRWTDGLLQQGSIPLSLDHGGMARVFRGLDAEEIKGSMAGLRELAPRVTLEDLEKAVVEGFARALSLDPDPSGPEEKEKGFASRLQKEKYSHRSWTHSR